MAILDAGQPNRVLRALEAIVVVVAALYFGRPILVPVALAFLLTFLLAPVVSTLQHWRLPRVVAVGLVICFIFAGSYFVVWKTVEQLSDLVMNLPSYRQNLLDKLNVFRGSHSATLQALERTVSQVEDNIQQATQAARIAVERAAEATDQSLATPVPVRIVSEPVNALAALQVAFAAITAPLVQAGIVTVLVIFMLLSYDELRNRLVRLAGMGRISLTTRTLDELGTRISRYLLINALVNGCYGLVIGLGLHFIGVHYSVLWGCLAAVLRFVPYVGPFAATVMPLAMAIIQFPTWTQPLVTAGLFGVCELITNSVVEPLVYGKTSGISTVAILIAAIFWSWIWGPVGLILSVPLTVCLAVLGKYLPPLEPLWILLGDDPPLPPHAQLYQRLLADDSDEADGVVEHFTRAHSGVETSDQLFIPCLVLAERDRARGQMSEGEYATMLSTIKQFVDEYIVRPTAQTEPALEPTPGLGMASVLCIPAADQGDELALEMLARNLPAHVEITAKALDTLASEIVERIAESSPGIVCISSLGSGGTRPIRYFCKRIRQRSPNARILVGCWGYPDDAATMTAGLCARGASQVVTTIHDAVDAIERVGRSNTSQRADAIEAVTSAVAGTHVV